MPPLILAIDTSCDDTSAAVTAGTLVLSNVIASQAQLHKPYGGVFPTVAKQAHKENIDRVVEVALKRAQVAATDLAAIAVTQGPGLAPALEVGIQKAQLLSQELRKPLIAVNHVEGHVLSPLAQPRTQSAPITAQYPALALIVSGRHTQFVLVSEPGSYQTLGQSIDDAAGECLDKIGRMLNLGYPAAPVIEELARRGDPQAIKFPLPLTHIQTFDLSFSGLKTFARNLLAKMEAHQPLSQKQIYDFSASVQYAVFRHIIYKLNKVIQIYQVQEIWLGGGVAANTELRRQLRTTIRPFGLQLKVPYSKRLCMDNAAMIGVAAGFKLERGETTIDKIDRKPRWPLSSL